MSQEQPRRPQEDEQQRESQYGVDAYLELAAEKAADSAVQSPVGLKLINADEFSFSNRETERSEQRVIFEPIGGQVTSQNSRHVDEKERKISGLAKVIGKNSQRGPLSATTTGQPVGAGTGSQITIGEALEATALTAGQKPVEWSDAAAIQAAEVRATGRTNIVPGGVAAAAQSAATLNARATRDEDKTKLADILADATSKLPADKPATRRDAEGVTGAEMRNDPYLTTHPTGVAASVAAAARLNQGNCNEGTK
ncbi:late embryogenesis abundant protein D-34-like [Argentina anserina]|uniref:late embryogenesis abundant protein D-34-like n=1 Tax=Argentina anserina TaxID=57926 RepID=UPI00217666CF|nr:late embryogenesis abundant protein D-34-like [Potentilla anserina]